MVTFNVLHASLPAQGWLDFEEAILMYIYAGLTEGPILEVGSYCGRSAVCLAALERPVLCVDPFDNFDSTLDGDEVERRFKANTGHLRNITLFREKVEDWAPRQVGFAFLDGDHTYDGTVAQIEKALACNPKYIALHDVNDTGDGALIRKACLEFFPEWELRAGKMAVFDVAKRLK